MSDAVRNLARRIADGGDGGRSRKNAINFPLIGIAVSGLVLLLYSSFYRVDASDQGIVLRFGKHHRTVEPGLQMKMPWPIETVHTVPVRRIQTLEFGFRTVSAGRTTSYASKDSGMNDVADMLTGDLNLAHVEWIVQFRISDAYQSLFKVGTGDGPFWDTMRNSEINPAIPDTIQDVSETVMRKLVGDRSVDAVLTMGREEIASEAKREIQAMLDSFETGVEVITVKLQTTSPPEPVKDAFQDVNRARQNKERVVNEAEGDRNRQIPAARGKRDQMISEAEGYREMVTKETTGLVVAYNAKLAEYEKAPEITKQRLYLEAMEEVLSAVGSKTIIDESVNRMLPILNLNGNDASQNPLRGN